MGGARRGPRPTHSGWRHVRPIDNPAKQREPCAQTASAKMATATTMAFGAWRAANRDDDHDNDDDHIGQYKWEYNIKRGYLNAKYCSI